MGMDIPLEAIRQQISSAIDIVVHLGRLRDRSRRILEICEVGGVEQGKIRMFPLFRFEEKEERDGRIEGELVNTGHRLIRSDKCRKAGIREFACDTM